MKYNLNASEIKDVLTNFRTSKLAVVGSTICRSIGKFDRTYHTLINNKETDEYFNVIYTVDNTDNQIRSIIDISKAR